MRNFNVRAWISESDYELVRLDAEAMDTVSFGLGLSASDKSDLVEYLKSL